MNDSPESAGKDKPWVPVEPGLFQYPLVDGQEPALLANRCKKCEKSFFPKRRLCPNCFETDMEEIRLNRRGKIYSATVVHIPSPAGIKAPYAYGYVDITGNNIRVFALFTGANLDAFVPGREVEMVLEPIAENRQGHPVGASGVAQIVEIAWQLRGDAGKRQVEGARVGLAQIMGGSKEADTRACTVNILIKDR